MPDLVHHAVVPLRGMQMSRTTLNIDPDLVDLAKKELGTASTNETLEAALRQVVQRSAERRFYELLSQALSDVDDLGAWRRDRWRGSRAE